MSQKRVLRKAFLDGRVITAKQISAQYGIASPSRVIERLRQEDGLPITSRRTVNSKGRVVYKYGLGRASVAVVAAGYKALAAGLV